MADQEIMQNKISAPPQKVLSRYALLVLVVTVLINLLSAYIRHEESGLDCQPWPDCYAVIGEMVATENSGEIAQKALAPNQLAKQMHRTIATLLVIGVLLLIHQSRKPAAMKGVNPALPYLLLAVILLLSVIGPASYLKTLPIIAVINLVGGFTLTAISWWLYLQLNQQRSRQNPDDKSSLFSPQPVIGWQKKLWLLSGASLIAQITLGAWVSANFAATACDQLLSCPATDQFLRPGGNSFWYFRELTLNDSGRVLFDTSTLTIHRAHRWLAAVTTVLLLTSALTVIKQLPRQALIVAGLVVAQPLVGALMILFAIPMILVMAHNLIAALLLLTVLATNFQLISIKNV